ncbi:hypothetical protein FKW77_004384 [Venturia effusa]|uniref:Uncharacterized protein n=1 Tax=Venturia effusa TaxID=50376 RepID=A0A517LMP5_9PEZI|nr:hypothetical protein FKW77_004384 [Venturia effusa]
MSSLSGRSSCLVQSRKRKWGSDVIVVEVGEGNGSKAFIIYEYHVRERSPFFEKALSLFTDLLAIHGKAAWFTDTNDEALTSKALSKALKLVFQIKEHGLNDKNQSACEKYHCHVKLNTTCYRETLGLASTFTTWPNKEQGKGIEMSLSPGSSDSEPAAAIDASVLPSQSASTTTNTQPPHSGWGISSPNTTASAFQTTDTGTSGATGSDTRTLASTLSSSIGRVSTAAIVDSDRGLFGGFSSMYRDRR